MLDTLESTVLERITAHRTSRNSAASLSIALMVALTALASGVLTGIAKPHHRTAAQGSEAVLLADDIGLAPSFLLASN
jgi:uncharacterized membrane protein HdeD (DUF308 family)